MYPENNEEKRTNPNSEELSDNEAIQSDVIYLDSGYNDQALNIPVYQEPVYPEPVYQEPVYQTQEYQEPIYQTHVYREPIYQERVYQTPIYRDPVYQEPVYREPTGGQAVSVDSHETPWNMYSPGICVNQPYPPPRINESGKNGASREKGSRLGGFLRAVCLIIICSVFSGIASYAVMDYRFERGDFTVNRVVLGGNASEILPEDEDSSQPMATLTNNITAQDIYDMAKNQVVGIITEAPGLFGLPGSNGASPISGSGFVISTDGYILTNFHVIEFAHNNNLPLSVVLNDGNVYDAEVVGYEESNDVAVIKIDAPGLTPALIGNSDNIRVGQTVYAVGNPFGDLVYTMTDGIISALDRVVSVEGKSINTFQFSAAVNRGNSGGPIYDTNGEVLGIVTAKIVRGNVEGIGFAIPINDAIEIASELIEHGYISGRPLLGITANTVSPANAEYYEWVPGTLVRSVNPGSAAETAGIIVGDIITSLDDTEITSMEDLRFTLRGYNAGDTATVTVWREGESIELTITFDEDMNAGRP